jgi:hypothetical protein
MVVGNMIAMLAAGRAVSLHLGGGAKRWDKTRYIFPAELQQEAIAPLPGRGDQRLRLVPRGWRLRAAAPVAVQSRFLSSGRRRRRHVQQPLVRRWRAAGDTAMYRNFSAGLGLWGAAQPGLYPRGRWTA